MVTSRFLSLILSALCAGSPLFAQDKPPVVPVPRDLPVDRLTYEGAELRGLVFGTGPTGELWFACRREWLRKTYPDLATKLENDQNDREWALRVDYARRLAAWDKSLEASPANEQLKGFIDEQISRMDPGLGADGAAGKGPFVLVRLLPKQPRKLIRAKPEYLKLVLVAWHEHIDQVESQSASQTIAALKADNIAWDKQTPDFSEKMPGIPVENEADWELRKAYLSYMHGQKLNFQGTGNSVLEAPEGGGAIPGAGLQEILGKLGPGLLDGALGDLLGEKGPGQNEGSKAVAEASAIADKKNAAQFRITRVEPDLPNRKVTIDDRVYSKMAGPKGPEWRLIHSRTQQADATIPRPQVEAQILKDPKVGPLIAQIRQLGLGEKLDEGIRFGAATLEAKEQADTAFNSIMRQFTRRIDGIPIRWSSPSPALPGT